MVNLSSCAERLSARLLSLLRTTCKRRCDHWKLCIRTILCTHEKIHRSCPRSLSVLHCVMESDTPCAPPVLAPSTHTVIPETKLINETATGSLRTLLAGTEARCCGSSDRLICCSMWVGFCSCVGVWALRNCQIWVHVSRLSLHNRLHSTMTTCVECLQNMEV